MTGRLLLTDLPQRQPRRISVSPAGTHSDPNVRSNGLAGIPHTREATPIHPGLVSLPGSQSIFDTPDVADQPGRSSLRRAPCGSVLGRCRTFFPLHTKRDQLGGDLLRDGAQRLPGVGLLHHSKMEQSHAEVVASDYVTERG